MVCFVQAVFGGEMKSDNFSTLPSEMHMLFPGARGALVFALILSSRCFSRLELYFVCVTIMIPLSYIFVICLLWSHINLI